MRELSGALDDVATAISGVTASTVAPSVDTVPLEHALALVNKIKDRHRPGCRLGCRPGAPAG